MTLRIERYKNTRHWALYDGSDLVVGLNIAKLSYAATC